MGSAPPPGEQHTEEKLAKSEIPEWKGGTLGDLVNVIYNFILLFYFGLLLKSCFQ